MTFNPHDILAKIRKKEYTPSKTAHNMESYNEKKNFYISGSSSSSGNIANSFDKPPSEKEYIGNLLNKIQALEQKVTHLELELAESRNEVAFFRKENAKLEEEVIKSADIIIFKTNSCLKRIKMITIRIIVLCCRRKKYSKMNRKL